MPRRSPNQLRAIRMTPHYTSHPEGAVLIEVGDTRVLCTATVEERLPPWLMGKGRGWVTAEYDMLPRATNTRNQRDSHKGKISGRSQEIGRLIGRAMRASVDLVKLGERQITIDCDVLQADGGTRTASITGGYVALALATHHLLREKKLNASPLIDAVAAVSVGIIDGEPFLDLDYGMDSRADVDMNVVMTGKGSLVEVQGTGENATFSRKQLDNLLDLALGALPDLRKIQDRAVELADHHKPTTVEL